MAVARKTRKKRRARPELSSVYYVVQITDWDWSYGFSVNVPKWEERRYSDYRHLLIRGRVLLPTKLKLKADTAELACLPDVRPEDIAHRGEQPPRGVGHLSISDGKLTGSLSMASDALDPVIRLLLAGRLNFLDLYGEPLRYRQALIRSYQIVNQLKVEDYPDD
ncbi:hypothetical protein [Bradyrhizobium sp. TM239]|uniref:hypothetical protein n=1 Tax=Bradyrhizobium sp. TM239 TaxID=2599802 RepID=UPI0027D59D10|nr:hypothetical protein TM239_03000 [Bradyrhizobium sp. TM239]